MKSVLAFFIPSSCEMSSLLTTGLAASLDQQHMLLGSEASQKCQAPYAV